ncbi:MAG: hypothetical protein ACK5V3_07250 [Bdellovibrionales bacterium]
MGSMPRKLIYTLSIPVLFISGWWSAKAFTQKSDPHYSQKILTSVKNQSTISMEKHLMPVTITLVPVTEIPEGPDELVTIKGQLKTPFDDFDAIHYEWQLEDGVEAVKGQLKGVFENPVAGHVYEIELLIKNFDKQNKREIVLQGYVLDNQGIRLGNATNITSRPEDSLEHIAPIMMVKAQEMRKELESADRLPANE